MKRHPFSVLSFTAGVVFLALAIAFLAVGEDVVDKRDWIAPVMLLSIGGAGVLSVLRRED